MQKRGLSQESLKLIACIAMLIDHMGEIVLLQCLDETTGAAKGMWLDVYKACCIVGRLAFPIFCFLLVEGAFYTKNPKRYGIRLLIGALLSEIPYDFAFYGSISYKGQSVMLTLLLGFAMLQVFKKCPNLLLRMLAVLLFAIAAEYLRGDYGYLGILVIAVFAITYEHQNKHLWRFLLLWLIFSPVHMRMLNWSNDFSYEIQQLATLAVVPISLYSGQKATKSKLLQWAFYLFYPVHIGVLYLISCI